MYFLPSAVKTLEGTAIKGEKRVGNGQKRSSALLCVNIKRGNVNSSSGAVVSNNVAVCCQPQPASHMGDSTRCVHSDKPLPVSRRLVITSPGD